MENIDRPALRIALLGPAPPIRGGISLFAYNLAKELQAEHHTVKMFSFKRQYPDLIFPGGDQFDHSSSPEDIETAPVCTPYLPWTWPCAVKQIRAYKPDLLIISYWLPFFAPAYAWITSKLKGMKIYYLAHNIQSHEKWPLGSLLRNRALQDSQKIIVLSESCLKDANHYLPLHLSRRVVLGFHPVSGADQATVGGNREKTLLFFGLIKPYKGLDILLRSMPRILQSIPDARLIVAGEVYGDPAPYHKLIGELGLEDKVELHFKYISEPEIKVLFQRAQVCVLPYKSATQSGVIASSYSYNVPVIASDIGGLGEYIVEGITGYLVEPEDPEALAAQIVSFFQNNDFERMREEIVKYKASFSWQALAEFILSL